MQMVHSDLSMITYVRLHLSKKLKQREREREGLTVCLV